jgi:hypothetical protein
MGNYENRKKTVYPNKKEENRTRNISEDLIRIGRNGTMPNITEEEHYNKLEQLKNTVLEKKKKQLQEIQEESRQQKIKATRMQEIHKLQDKKNEEEIRRNKEMAESAVMATAKNSTGVARMLSTFNLFSKKSDGGYKNKKPSVSQSKEILGKQRRIYKVAGSRKEHVKYKGQLIPVSDYKKLMKPKH